MDLFRVFNQKKPGKNESCQASICIWNDTQKVALNAGNSTLLHVNREVAHLVSENNKLLFLFYIFEVTKLEVLSEIWNEVLDEVLNHLREYKIGSKWFILINCKYNMGFFLKLS